MRRYAVRLAVAVLGAAAVGLGAPGAARAATCSTASGVSVVVDFHQLGNVQSACDAAGGGKTAATQLTDVGHTLTYVQRQPGFVCRVDGTPKSDPCVNTPPSDAYWSLWWSDGKSGSWTYSSAGVGSLTVPAGGYVALSWQGSSSKAPPRVSPTPHPAPSSSPTTHPTRTPSGAPSSAPTSAPPPASTTSAGVAVAPTGGASPTGPAAPRSTAKPGHASHPHHHQASSGSGTPSQGASTSQAAGELGPVTPASSDGGSGLPGWVAPVVVVALFGAAGALLVVRRRRSGGA